MPSYQDAIQGLESLDRRGFLRLAAIGAAGAAGAALGLPREAEAGRGGGAGSREPIPFGAILGADGVRTTLYWNVKVSSAKVGPGPNVFSDSTNDVWLDAVGLHLTITKYGSQWRCTEVIGQASLGYGTYRWTIAPGNSTSTPPTSDVNNLDPSVVLGLFTWNDAPEYAHREIDIEFAKWSDLSKPRNAQYTVQPWDLTGHRYEFNHQTTGATIHEFTWNPGNVSFRSLDALGAVKHAWTFPGPDSHVPVPGGENPRMNLWLFRGKPPATGQRVHVVLSDFTFTPA